MYKILIGLILLVVIGCSVHYFPISTESIKVNDGVASLKNSNYYLSIEQRSWQWQPEQMNQIFSCFYITIINRTKDDMIIEVGDFVLENEDGDSFFPIQVKRVRDFFAPLQTESEDFNFSNSESELYDTQEVIDNINRYSLFFGNLPPQKQREGFIFFPKLSKNNNKYTLIYNSDRFEFRKSEGKSKE